MTALTAYSTVGMGLRSARVVVVFDGGEHWPFWARRALYVSGFAWGGAGFALVPHRAGVVDPVLLRLCEVYDPDHVVTIPVTIGELEQLKLGVFHQAAAGKGSATLDEVGRFPEDTKDQDVGPLPADLRARQRIVEACSVYRLRTDDGQWDEAKKTLHAPRYGEVPEAMSIPGSPGGVALTCPPSWGGLLGVAVAARAGCVDRPDPAAVAPALDDPELASLTEWLLGGKGRDLPRSLLWSSTGVVGGVLTENMSLVHDRTLLGLVPVSDTRPRRRPHLVVVGDEPEDFALARLWQLIYGVGHWVPSTMGTSRKDLPPRLGMALHSVGNEAHENASLFMLTSISRTTDQLEADRTRLLSAFPYLAGSDVTADLRVVGAQQLPWKGLARNYWAVRDQFDDRYTVPTTISANGTKDMAAPLPIPAFRDSALAASDVACHVDVSWEAEQCVRARGLEGVAVFTADNPRWLTRARRGRTGTSYEAARYDMVLTGTQAENRLARPRLRDLSLRDWVEAKAGEYGLQIQTSRAGHRSAQLARMLGSRAAFVDLFSGPLLPVLRAMRPTESSSSVAYPNKDGVRLSASEGCLTFTGVCNRAAGLPPDEVRRQLDAALRTSVLRRGLVVRCHMCEDVQFQIVDKLGQRWTCLRCDALNDLDQRAWHLPPEEPQWYYDLHPVGRHLLREHGEVPALLSAYLASERPNHSGPLYDVDELELVREGKPFVELDLIAYVDDTLIVAECKSTDTLAGSNADIRREIDKKCQAAARLRADHLIFATTKPAWADRMQGLIRSTVLSHSWGPLGAPSVRLVTSLGATLVGCRTL